MSLSLTPGLIDAILVAVALEFVAVSLLLAGASARRLIGLWSLYLGSGAALLVALRLALAGAAPAWIALALLASLATHTLSLVRGRRVLLPRPDGRGPTPP